MVKKDENDYGIGKVLKQLRTNRKLTQIQLAEKMGVSLNTIKQYENNMREPRYDYLLKLCDFFNVEPEFFKSKLHFKIEDIKKYNDTLRITQSKKIHYERSFSQLKYREMLDKVVENNINSTHVLKLISAMNSVIDSLSKICINNKKQYLFYKSEIYDKMEKNIMYYDYNRDNMNKKLKVKPVSEIEMYVYREKVFDEEMKKIQILLKEIMFDNFKEDYVSYKNNFRKATEYLED